jgi:hypothetical protein
MPSHPPSFPSLALLALATASPLVAQQGPERAAAIRRAAETITPSAYRARVAVIADDSMRGRDTPSPELEQVASWVASEFRRIGLRPGGDAGRYIQRYQLRRSRVDSSTTVTGTAVGAMVTWRLGRGLALVGGTLPPAPTDLPVVLLSGLPADAARLFGEVTIRGAAVMHVVTPEQLNGPALNQLVGQAIAAGVAAWIVVADVPAPRWEGWLRRGLRAEQWDLLGDTAMTGGATPPVMAVRDSAAAGLLAAAGADLSALRAAAGSGIRPLPGLRLALKPGRHIVEEPTLPNVVGVLEGSDNRLRNEAVVFVAHMDHVGVTANGRCAAVGADSVCNGANDNASGTVGVVELAEAYASLQPRPRRSLVFVAVSGEERGLFGSRYYAGHPVVLNRAVAAIALDEIARNTPDTMIVIGKGFSSLGSRMDEIVRAHPELELMALDDLWPEQNFFQRSDHYPFALRGVPALCLYGGNSAEVHRANDAVETADWDKASRIARAAFYLGLDAADRVEPPQWDPAARQRIVPGAR